MQHTREAYIYFVSKRIFTTVGAAAPQRMLYRTTWPLSSNMKMVLSVNFASFLDIMNKHYVNVLSLRNICCCQINLKNYATKEGRVMRKLLGNKPSEKKPWYKSEYISNNPALPSSNISRIQRNYKRTTILNKLFMRHITDMMATGEVASDIVGKGIQISRVQVAPDFNKINVFWLTKGIESDDEVEAILKQSAGQLRHELTQLHVIGVVPRIEFIKDKQYAKLVEVDRILATADFGEDYVPVNAGYSFTLNTKLPSEIEHHSEVPERPLPPMRMDVLGLKHDEIMTKVKKSLKKSRAPHRQKPSDHTAVQQDVSVRKEELTKFLTRRQFMQKERKNYSPEFDL